MSLFTDYRDAITTLTALYRERAGVEQSRARARAEAWMHSTETSVAGRERDADIASIDYHAQLLDVDADIKAAELELQFIRDMAQYGSVLNDGQPH